VRYPCKTIGILLDSSSWRNRAAKSRALWVVLPKILILSSKCPQPLIFRLSARHACSVGSGPEECLLTGPEDRTGVNTGKASRPRLYLGPPGGWREPAGGPRRQPSRRRGQKSSSIAYHACLQFPEHERSAATVSRSLETQIKVVEAEGITYTEKDAGARDLAQFPREYRYACGRESISAPESKIWLELRDAMIRNIFHEEVGPRSNLPLHSKSRFQMWIVSRARRYSKRP